MRKLKVYLDTSVISHLMQEDVPEKMADTLQLWELFREGMYDVYLSTVTLEEVSACPEPKRIQLKEYMAQISYTILDITVEALGVTQKMIDLGILKPKSYDDCQHIGAAVVNNCDCIISWNFKHIVNIKTIHGIRAVTNLEGYKNIDILSPTVLLESEG